MLEALVAGAGVTLMIAATALDFRLGEAVVLAEGNLDFRDMLGVVKEAPFCLGAILRAFKLDTDEPKKCIDVLIKLTERYYVAFQTLNVRPELSVSPERWCRACSIGGEAVEQATTAGTLSASRMQPPRKACEEFHDLVASESARSMRS